MLPPRAAHRPTEGGVETLRKHLRAKRPGPAPALDLQVTQIRRYVADESYLAITNGRDNAAKTAFDLVLSDGAELIKVVAAPTLHRDLLRHAIQESSVISLLEYRAVRDEHEIGGEVMCVLQRVELLERSAVLFVPEEGTLRYNPETSGERERWDVPVASERGFYLSNLSDDCPEGDGWQTAAEDLQIFGWPDVVMSNDRNSIADIKRSFGSSRVIAYVVGRLTRKHRLNQFATRNASMERYPMNFVFDLTDETDTIKVTVWNSKCKHYLNALHLGQSLLITGFRVKRSHTDNSVELAVNPRTSGDVHKFSAEGEVLLLAPDLAPFLPAYPWNLLSASRLHEGTEELLFDVVGVIAALGPLTRERSESKQPNDPPQLFLWRWIVLRDDSSHHPLRVRAFVNSQQPVFDSLAVGDVLLLTDVHLLRPSRLVATTVTSQYLVGAELPLADNDQVRRVVSWSRRSFRPSPTDTHDHVFTNASEFAAVWPAATPQWFAHMVAASRDIRYLEARHALLQCSIKSLRGGEASEGEEQSGKRPAAAMPRVLSLTLESVNGGEVLQVELRLPEHSDPKEALLALLNEAWGEGRFLTQAERNAFLNKSFSAGRLVLEKAIKAHDFVAAVELYLAESDHLVISLRGLFAPSTVERARKPAGAPEEH